MAGPVLPYPTHPTQKDNRGHWAPWALFAFLSFTFSLNSRKVKGTPAGKGKGKKTPFSPPHYSKHWNFFDIWLLLLFFFKGEVNSSSQKKSFRSKWYSAVIRGKLVFIRAVIIQHGGREAGNLCNLSQIRSSEQSTKTEVERTEKKKQMIEWNRTSACNWWANIVLMRWIHSEVSIFTSRYTYTYEKKKPKQYIHLILCPIFKEEMGISALYHTRWYLKFSFYLDKTD